MDQCKNSQEVKKAATKVLVDHQKYAQLAIWVRRGWKRDVATICSKKSTFKVILLQILGAHIWNPPSILHNRILGVSVLL
jgi:hypothetical protein